MGAPGASAATVGASAVAATTAGLSVARQLDDPVAGPMALPDPGASGPQAVTATEYNDGDTAFTPPGFPGPVEVRASVHYPTELGDSEHPLVVIMHGRHSTCYSGGASYMEWPCAAGRETIPSFQGYDYLAENLASWGYIVVSVSANGINARDNNVADLGMQARAELIQLHLDKWQEFTTKGADPFGSLFVGAVDLQNVGTMGHSRGGEGVAQHFLLNEDLGSPYGIQAVMPLAPVDFNRQVVDDVALSVMLPYCDGDVSDLQGAHFYDDARYSSPDDVTPKYMQEVLGANHNHFNTIWTPGGWPAGTFDDGACTSGELTAEEQRNVGEAYIAGFFRLHLGGETAMAPYFDGTMIEPPSIGAAQVHTAYQAPGDERRDVNRFLDADDLSTNFLGGDVTKKRLQPFDLCGGEDPQPLHCLSVGSSQQPHTVPSYLSSKRGLSQLRYGWSKPSAHMTNAIPGSSQDVSGFAAVTFRTARNFTDPLNPPDRPRSLSIVLTDGSGGTHSERLKAWSDALFAQPAVGSGTPKLVHNTVRVPLSAFTDVDLSNVTEVTLRHDRSDTGSLLLTDLAFSDATDMPMPLGFSVRDVTKPEGKSLRFAVTLSEASAEKVKITAATADGTATAPADYASTSKRLKFAPGEAKRVLKVATVADGAAEPDETVLVDLTAPDGAMILDGQAVGTITDD